MCLTQENHNTIKLTAILAGISFFSFFFIVMYTRNYQLPNLNNLMFTSLLFSIFVGIIFEDSLLRSCPVVINFTNHAGY